MTTTLLGGDRVWRDLQKIIEAESVVRPKYIVTRLDLLLAAADRGELVVQKQAPKLGGGLLRCADSGDEEVLEFGIVGAIKSLADQLCRCIESICAGIARRGVRAVVGAVAEVCASGCGGDVTRSGVDRSFVDSVVRTLDTYVDYVGSDRQLLRYARVIFLKRRILPTLI